jgi:hypothetical protein
LAITRFQRRREFSTPTTLQSRERGQRKEDEGMQTERQKEGKHEQRRKNNNNNNNNNNKEQRTITTAREARRKGRCAHIVCLNVLAVGALFVGQVGGVCDLGAFVVIGRDHGTGGGHVLRSVWRGWEGGSGRKDEKEKGLKNRTGEKRRREWKKEKAVCVVLTLHHHSIDSPLATVASAPSLFGSAVFVPA